MDSWRRDHLRALLSPSLKGLCSFEGRNSFEWSANVALAEFWRKLAGIQRSRLRRKQKLICVVGSYAKTTTCRALRAALQLPQPEWAERNLNCFSDVYISYLRQAAQPVAVLEVGIGGPGQMAEYAGILQPDMVIFTSLGREHIQSFDGLAHLLKEKAQIIQHMRCEGTLIVNGDNQLLDGIGESSIKRVSFGLSAQNDFMATDCQYTSENTRFTVSTAGETAAMYVPLLGQPAVYSVLSAISAACLMGHPLAEMPGRFRQFSATGGRLQPSKLANGAIVIRDDCKSTVDTMHMALDTLSLLEAKRKIAVLGSLDSPPPPVRDTYREAGRKLAESADLCFVVGDKAGHYLNGWKSVTGTGDGFTAVDEIGSAIREMQGILSKGDVVLVKGRTQQRLGRLALALQQYEVRCTVTKCNLHSVNCEHCPRLSSGYKNMEMN